MRKPYHTIILTKSNRRSYRLLQIVINNRSQISWKCSYPGAEGARLSRPQVSQRRVPSAPIKVCRREKKPGEWCVCSNWPILVTVMLHFFRVFRVFQLSDLFWYESARFQYLLCPTRATTNACQGSYMSTKIIFLCMSKKNFFWDMEKFDSLAIFNRLFLNSRWSKISWRW